MFNWQQRNKEVKSRGNKWQSIHRLDFNIGLITRWHFSYFSICSVKCCFCIIIIESRKCIILQWFFRANSIMMIDLIYILELWTKILSTRAFLTHAVVQGVGRFNFWQLFVGSIYHCFFLFFKQSDIIDNCHLTLKKCSAQDIETSVTNNSPCPFHQDDQIPWRHHCRNKTVINFVSFSKQMSPKDRTICTR